MEKLEAMKIFLRVAELKSFTRAAESLSLPKANVSLAVSQLEELLGTRLLQRTTRRVSVTPDGELFLQRCQTLVADWEETESMFRGDRELVGKLRVDMPVNLTRRIMPKLADFLNRHPRLELELSTTDRLVDVVGEGFDCVVRVGGAPPLHDVSSQLLGHLPLCNCASPLYIAAFGTPACLDDLSTHHLIHYASRFGGRTPGFEYYDGTQCRNIEMKGKITVNNSDAYQAACLAGLGIIQVPVVGVRHHLESGALVTVLEDYPAEPMPLVTLHPATRHLSRRWRVFHEWLVEALRGEVEPLGRIGGLYKKLKAI